MDLSDKHNEVVFKSRLDYAWNYFQYHANQRTVMFNFLLISVGLILNAFVISYGSFNLFVPLIIALLGFFVCLHFKRLDIRNEQLLYYARAVLTHLEENILFVNAEMVKKPERLKVHKNKIPLGIFKAQDKVDDHTSIYSHSKNLRSIHNWLLVLFIALLLFALLDFFIDYDEIGWISSSFSTSDSPTIIHNE